MTLKFKNRIRKTYHMTRFITERIEKRESTASNQVIDNDKRHQRVNHY